MLCLAIDTTMEPAKQYREDHVMKGVGGVEGRVGSDGGVLPLWFSSFELIDKF